MVKKFVETSKQTFSQMWKNMDSQIQNLNNSKVFAGLMIITLNIASKFVNIKLGKTMERYLKYTFSKQILVFAIAWMGTRDIYIALIIVFFFTLIVDVLLDDDSPLCILPESFVVSQEGKEEQDGPSDEEVEKAKKVLAKAEEKNKEPFKKNIGLK